MKPVKIDARKDELDSSDFVEISRLNGSIVGLFRAPADSWIWECHPEGDELLQILEGEMEITLLIDGESQTSTLKAGELFLVPKGVWHRPKAISDTDVLFVTPERSLISSNEDPTRDESVEDQRM